MSVIAMWSSQPGRARDLSLLQMSRAALSPRSLLFREYRRLCPRRCSGWGVRLNTPQGENPVKVEKIIR
jgi:hypothetical protein